jgi:RNA polymerase sigma-70 factor (ECF subfamily)
VSEGIAISTASEAGVTAASEGPSDREAIHRVLAGDREAFRVLVQRYQGRAFRLAVRVLRDEDAARDAVQEAFVKAYSALGRFEGRSGFYTWLYRLVMNQCLDARRRDRSDRHQAYEEGSVDEAAVETGGFPVEVAGVPFGPAAAVMQSQLRKALAEAIERLPEGARETLWLRELEGLSYAEIATAQGIPKGTVMSRLHYARRQLQQYLREAGIEVEAEAGRQREGEGEEGERT